MFEYFRNQWHNFRPYFHTFLATPLFSDVEEKSSNKSLSATAVEAGVGIAAATEEEDEEDLAAGGSSKSSNCNSFSVTAGVCTGVVTGTEAGAIADLAEATDVDEIGFGGLATGACPEMA
jgi:hypothetical protein